MTMDQLLRDLGGADAYAVLGVDERADEAEVRRAYRRRLRALHPDTGGSVATASADLPLATAAGELLSRHRKDYDDMLALERGFAQIMSELRWPPDNVIQGRTNICATVAVALALSVVLGPLAVLLGCVALRQLRTRAEIGHGFAVVSIVLGTVESAVIYLPALLG